MEFIDIYDPDFCNLVRAGVVNCWYMIHIPQNKRLVNNSGKSKLRRDLKERELCTTEVYCVLPKKQIYRYILGYTSRRLIDGKLQCVNTELCIIDYASDGRAYLSTILGFSLEFF